jgi:hypothetical protein
MHELACLDTLKKKTPIYLSMKVYHQQNIYISPGPFHKLAFVGGFQKPMLTESA